MADCDVCGSPLSAGIGDETWQSHVANFNDPHRTLELVREILPGLSVGSAAPDSTDDAKPGDWFADLASGSLWACLPQQDGSLAWTKIADRSPASADLSAYATREMLADYATVASLSGYLRPTDLSGYNFITQYALADALSPLASKTYVANAISAGGFLTQAMADGRYVLVGDAAGHEYVTRTQLAEALAGYLSTSAAGLVSSSALSTELASYVTQANVESVVNAKVSAVAETFATAEDLADLASSIAIEKGNGTALATLEPGGGKFRPTARSNNLVVLTGDMGEIPLLMPARSQGAARDFILTVAFDRGTSMWAKTSFEVLPETRQSETVQCRFYSATDGVFAVDASLLDLDRQMVVFGFTEVADGRFLVSRKIVTEQGA